MLFWILWRKFTVKQLSVPIRLFCVFSVIYFSMRDNSLYVVNKFFCLSVVLQNKTYVDKLAPLLHYHHFFHHKIKCPRGPNQSNRQSRVHGVQWRSHPWSKRPPPRWQSFFPGSPTLGMTFDDGVPQQAFQVLDIIVAKHFDRGSDLLILKTIFFTNFDRISRRCW